MSKFILKYIAILSLLAVFSMNVSAQIGGDQTYEFLKLTNSARIASMGGDFLAVKDHDITLTLANPSLITPEMSNVLSMSVAQYKMGPKFGNIMYSRTFEKFGSFAGTFNFVNYGKFTAADEMGNIYGEFSASEYALAIGWARQLGPLFSLGANGKLIYSSLESYNSFGIAVDVSATYLSKNNLFCGSLLARNIGVQVIPYISGNREPLPFELQAGTSLRFEHVPIRLSFLYVHIEKWDLSYDDPKSPDNQTDPVTGEPKEQSGFSEFADNFFQHLVFGAEFTIAKVLDIRAGYNYGHRAENKLYKYGMLTGFSCGSGLRIKMFGFNYGVKFLTANIPVMYYSFNMNIDGFKKKEHKGEEK